MMMVVVMVVIGVSIPATVLVMMMMMVMVMMMVIIGAIWIAVILRGPDSWPSPLLKARRVLFQQRRSVGDPLKELRIGLRRQDLRKGLV